MRKTIYSAILFSIFSSAAMAQSGNDSKDTWLYEHSHSYTKLGNIETPIESDTYYTYDEENILRQTHEVSVNEDGKYEHTYTMWMIVFDEMWPASTITSTNSYPDYFMSGVKSETRLETNRTTGSNSNQYTLVEKRYKNGNQAPYQIWTREYKYNNYGRVVSYKETIQNLKLSGDVKEEWVPVEKTYEYEKGRIKSYTTKNLLYFSKDSKNNKITTTTYSDFKYGSAELTETPLNAASTEWETWMKKNSSDHVSYTVTQTVDEGADGTVDETYVYTEDNNTTIDGDVKTYKRVTDSRDAFNSYKVYEEKVTDKLGSYTIHSREYTLAPGEEPADEKIRTGYMTTRTYTTEYDYEENTKRYADGKLKENPSSIYSQKSECSPEYGYLTRLQLDNTTYAGDQSVTNTFINTYDSYRRANGSVGINAINADTDAPVLIYNTQGICLGSQLSTLPKGLYIVKQGGKTTKVRK